MVSRPTAVAAVFSQQDFDEYARLSGDDNPIHVDPSFAANTRFGRPVAHGMLLYATLQAAIARVTGQPDRLRAQEFIFRAPTFTGDPLVMTLTPQPDGSISEEITDSSGAVTVSGVALPGEPDGTDPGPSQLTTSPGYKGLEVGASATRRRTFTTADVADYVRLARDPNPAFVDDPPELPPALLAGMDSWVLGVDLPGRGTNWLKQRFSYHRLVRVPVAVTTTVTITRIRPDKGLINLATRCTSAAGAISSGEALVLAVDVPPN